MVFLEFLLNQAKNSSKFKYMELDDIIIFNKKTDLEIEGST